MNAFLGVFLSMEDLSLYCVHVQLCIIFNYKYYVMYGRLLNKIVNPLCCVLENDVWARANILCLLFCWFPTAPFVVVDISFNVLPKFVHASFFIIISLELWGYKRVEEIIWVKTNQLQRIIRTGRTGHWLNHSKEHCLVGIKGDPIVNRNIDTDVIVAEVRETSRKPDEVK